MGEALDEFHGSQGRAALQRRDQLDAVGRRLAAEIVMAIIITALAVQVARDFGQQK